MTGNPHTGTAVSIVVSSMDKSMSPVKVEAVQMLF